MSEDTIELGEHHVLTIRERGPDALVMESTRTGSAKPPPVHWHPQQDEEFEILEGELTVRVGEEEPRVLTVGDTLTIPARTPHSMWSAGPGVTRHSWRITPPLRTEEMFRFMAKGTGGTRGPRMLAKYRAEFRLGEP